jgi:hypothetical protein
MPSVECICGNRLDFGAIPNPIEWLIISDRRFDELGDQIETDHLYREFLSVLRCPSCARLAAFWDGFSEAPTFYEPVERCPK